MSKKKYLRIFSVICLVAGVSLLTYVVFPIIKYDLDPSNRLNSFLNPIPDRDLPDLTKASNWFIGGAPVQNFSDGKIVAYTVSIPKLRIDHATVNIGGEDLAQSLIQYPGTAFPGKKGNSVIFGHSVLPQFFNPKNYKSIFSTLPTIKLGDKIVLEYDGVKYVYQVENKFEVLPTDLEVLEQNTDDAFVTLVTCVPPGHPLRPKRLIVRARLVGNNISDASGN